MRAKIISIFKATDKPTNYLTMSVIHTFQFEGRYLMFLVMIKEERDIVNCFVSF